MKIAKLLAERLGRAQADKVVFTVLEKPDRRLPELMEIYLGEFSSMTTLASMAFDHLAESVPQLVQSYQPRILQAALLPAHPSVRRVAIRYFSQQPVVVPTGFVAPRWAKKADARYLTRNRLSAVNPHLIENLEGSVLDTCAAAVADVNEPTANRAFGIQVCLNLLLKYPEIAGEIAGAIHDTIEHSTPGFKHRGNKALPILESLLE
ncbi:MAG: hypothetical protein WBA17_07490 [Saprospiraceae bacterium]